MNVRTLLLTIILATTGCTFQTSLHYADSLNDCLAPSDISLLNDACLVFERQLKERYKGFQLGQAYRNFLQDFRAQNIPSSFFTAPASMEVIENMRRSKTFDKIWTNSFYVEADDDSINSFNSESQQEESQGGRGTFCTNPNGVYLDCLLRKNKNKILADYLEAIKFAPGFSSGLMAKVLGDNLAKEDYNNRLTRLIIAVGFYYETGLMFDGECKNSRVLVWFPQVDGSC